jgi:hypothetical protein
MAVMRGAFFTESLTSYSAGRATSFSQNYSFTIMAESMPNNSAHSRDEKCHTITSSLQMESSGHHPSDAIQIKSWQLIPIIGSLWLGTMLVAIDNTIIGQ